VHHFHRTAKLRRGAEQRELDAFRCHQPDIPIAPRRRDGAADDLSAGFHEIVRGCLAVGGAKRDAKLAGDSPPDLDLVDRRRLGLVEDLERRLSHVEQQAAASAVVKLRETLETQRVLEEFLGALVVGHSDDESPLLNRHAARAGRSS
jgi:hypothetical protein